MWIKILALIFFLNLGTIGCANQIDQAKIENQIEEEIPMLKLNSGFKIPMLGFGTWTLSNSEAEDLVYFAIQHGYRLIDTAQYYGNEIGVGRAVNRAIENGIVRREEIFVTSKIVPRGDFDYDSEIAESLRRLNLDYLDLMLIHQSGRGDSELYRAMERGVESHKIRSIGISNYYSKSEIEQVTGGKLPAVIQNENHPLYQNSKLQSEIDGVAIESWYPLGGRGHVQEILSNPAIVKIAKSHEKSPAQIVLRWQIQSGFIAIPGSKNREHILENIDIFDFQLTPDEMKSMANLNQNRRFENW